MYWNARMGSILEFLYCKLQNRSESNLIFFRIFENRNLFCVSKIKIFTLDFDRNPKFYSNLHLYMWPMVQHHALISELEVSTNKKAYPTPPQEIKEREQCWCLVKSQKNFSSILSFTLLPFVFGFFPVTILLFIFYLCLEW